MRFGGHETFFIREGWMHKGLKMLIQEHESLSAPHVADLLGVGRNMAKSIKHWLLATGLAQRDGGSHSPMVSTPLAKSIWKHDRYFADDLTWWVLHIGLLKSDGYSLTWKWFFNHFNLQRFSKQVCLEGLKRYLNTTESRLPSDTTLQRDLDCLLRSYSTSLPAEQTDPEDAYVCPFAALGMMNFYSTSGYYETNRTAKRIPTHAFCYALSLFDQTSSSRELFTHIPLLDASRKVGSPGRILAMTSENLFALAAEVENKLGDRQLLIEGLAGERIFKLRKREPIEWLVDGYEVSKMEKTHAA